MSDQISRPPLQLIKSCLVIIVGLDLIVSSYYFYRTFDQCLSWESRILASQVFLINILTHLLVLCVIFRRPVIDTIIKFFLEPSHPNNLSIFRIVLFWYFFNQNYSNTISLSRIPGELHNASWQLPHWFLDYLPINEAWITTAVVLFRVFSLMACIGLLTRFSSLMALIIGFYILGAPQYLGKLNHYHHEFWFLAILAMSRCGDTLSCDSLIKTLKYKTGNRFDPPSSSIVYALPLRFIWILIGLLYFFPGFWKIWGSGLDWITSGQLKNYMYFKWMSYKFMPPFRIDQHPLLLGISATLVVLFEMSFVILIFSSRLRYWAVLGGLIFHKMTAIFMKIYFQSLVICYVVFFDWQRIGKWIIKKTYFKKEIFPEKLQYFFGYQGSTNLPEGCDKLGRPYAVILCGIVLILGNMYCGFNNYHSWPFSCYPTFQEISLDPYEGTLSMEAFDRKGGKLDYNKEAPYFSADNMREFLISLQFIWDDDAKVETRIRGFFELCKKNDPVLREATYVYFYYDTIDMTPENLSRNPVKRKEFFELWLD